MNYRKLYRNGSLIAFSRLPLGALGVVFVVVRPRFVITWLAPTNESLNRGCWDWSCTSSNVCLDGLVDGRAAATIVGVLGSIEESAGLGDEGPDRSELGDRALGSGISEWEDAWLDELGVTC